MDIKCGRCNKELEYGGYASEFGIDLCVPCAKDWYELKKRHKSEINEYWKYDARQPDTSPTETNS